ncbi:site-specific integrase [Gimesia sp.]|uniref:tyrosine-type recombinase/integrase n=1 Tax=Gimesia sp. TaxID=2024833 RepID=UPI0025C37C66|nr:site-specific integrase [Gimesia sp.]|tara:strand:- start:17588 stop:18775 length:1188 start_codon:yes stop_codon:yes gene_type:complete
MPRKRKNQKIKLKYFIWVISQRGKTYQADGRSNTINVGRHSLGTSIYEEAIDAVYELDRIKAVEHGLLDVDELDRQEKRSLSLLEGRQHYEADISSSLLTGGIRQSSQKRYRAVLDKFIKFCELEQISCWDQVDVKLLKRYAAYLESKDYAFRTIYLEVNTIKQIINWLIKEELLPNGKAIDLSLPKAQGTSTYCWKQTEVAVMVKYCRKNKALNWLGDIIICLACTGLRISELASLRWSDIDLEEGILRLTDETMIKKKSKASKRTTKSGYNRSFPINSTLMEVFHKMPNRSGNVFRGPRGGQLKPDTVRLILIRDVIKPLAKKFPQGEDEIGFADGRPHSFRHYFCSTCANSGIPENMVMRWLGHRSSEMVQHYYHLHDAEAKRRMDTLNFIG